MSYILQFPISAIIYLLMAIICWNISGIAIKSNKKSSIVWMLVIILTLFSGLRAYNVGFDTSLYIQNTLQLIQKGRFESAYGEVGFKLMIQLALIICNNYTSAFILLSFVSISLFVWRIWEIRDVVDFRICVLSFYCIHYLSIFNTVRQFLAFSIIFWGTRYLYDINRKSFFKYISIVLLASSFHSSAFLGLVLLCVCELITYKRFVAIRKLKLDFLLLILAIIGAFIILQIDRVQYLITYYLRNDEAYGGVMAYFKLAILIAIEVYVVVNKFNYKKMNYVSSSIVDAQLLIKTSKLFYFVGLLIQILGYHLFYFGRVGELFGIFELIYYCNNYDVYSVKKIKRIMILIISLYTLLSVLHSNGYGIMPYGTIFFSVK